MMLYVFGKTLICRNMEVATSFARKHGLDCITLGMVIIYKLIIVAGRSVPPLGSGSGRWTASTSARLWKGSGLRKEAEIVNLMSG